VHAFVVAPAHIVKPAGMPFGFMPMEFMPPPPAPAFFSFFSTMIACDPPQSSGLTWWLPRSKATQHRPTTIACDQPHSSNLCGLSQTLSRLAACLPSMDDSKRWVSLRRNTVVPRTTAAAELPRTTTAAGPPRHHGVGLRGGAPAW